jgi:hypothetical protein
MQVCHSLHPVLMVPTVAMVRIDIARADSVQTVGYFIWNSQQPGTDDLSPKSTPEALKEQRRSSHLALTPLFGWFHEVEAMRWPELDESHSTLLRRSIHRGLSHTICGSVVRKCDLIVLS